MNDEAVKELQRILNLNPEELKPHEVAFLNARRGYLNNDQKRIFASVLKGSPVKQEKKVEKVEVQNPNEQTVGQEDATQEEQVQPTVGTQYKAADPSNPYDVNPGEKDPNAQ
jgi:hypothetical protein